MRRGQEFLIYAAHTTGLTRLFQNAAGTIGVCSAPGGSRCFHCEGTGGWPGQCGYSPLWRRDDVGRGGFIAWGRMRTARFSQQTSGA
ncbi:hypothetical protein CG723_45160 [Streptomyces sp. CB01635]|nr:hypothetical protein CG723_45160 [Streptomyces sp. CB01635]